MGAVLAIWGRLSGKLGAQAAPGDGAGRCRQPPASDAQGGQGVCRGPVPRPEPRPTRGGALHTETLFITRPEVALWKQLAGALAPSLWRVRARGRCQRDAGALALSGPREAVLAAKVALSELLIRVGRGVPPAGRFFQLCPGLSLFLGQGDGAGLRAGAVVRLGTEAGRDGAGVSRQRALSRRGAPHACLEARCPPGAEGLTAGALLLALEAAARARVASVAVCVDVAGAWLAEALAGAVEAFAQGRPPAPLRSVSLVAADGALLAAFQQACAKRWPPGASRQELLGSVLRAQERVSTRVVTGPLASQKTEALVLPVVLEADGPEWWPLELRALAEAALGAAGPGEALGPGKVLTVPGAALPELHCQELFLVRLDGAALRQHGAPKVVRQMVRSCLCSVYGAFLESVSFPLLGAGQALPAMLEEISHFLEQQPNPWMKLVQIVCPPGQPAPGLVAEALSSPAGKSPRAPRKR
ncbi:uncharacterized protein LOC142825933 [Pelodiscus sinensis]|uniref:uncharacterized protein LOC142825933 n=1 Tax=Pelodiscus sinensis TaxID=13735 RepID=UPI003F6CF7F3